MGAGPGRCNCCATPCATGCCAARQLARGAASRLGVRLVLPLGLCYLPAFVLLGVMPVVAQLAGGIFE